MANRQAGYLHGFSSDEQDRLAEQAQFLAPAVYRHVDFSSCAHVLEVGCGVGAQTKILLDRFPNLQITALDTSPAQLARARAYLSDEIVRGRVDLQESNIAGVTLRPGQPSFDGAFFCWVLEHVPDPVALLKQTRSRLRSGAVVHCIEVMNASLSVFPTCPSLERYWNAYNLHQIEIGGDPFVGVKLGNHLKAAGFTEIEATPSTFHFDDRDPEMRRAFFGYWTKLLLSGAQSLLASGKVTEKEVAKMQDEMRLAQDTMGSVFFYSFMSARAIAP